MSGWAKCCRLGDPAALEDDISYVWRKALRGHAMDATGLARKCGVERAEIEALIAGKAPATLFTKAADILGLHTPALRCHGTYQPQVPHLHGVTRLSLPFEDDSVNAWLIREEDQTLLFDTGFERNSALDLLKAMGVPPLDLFITHDHRDHVGGISVLAPWVKKHHFMDYGQSLRLGGLEIRCIDLSGHCIPSYGYIIRGFSRLICVVGDALFAGSIGGCADAFTYDMALRNLRHHVMLLPDETILLTGHGPATTVGQEKASNPFLAGVV